MRYRINYMFIIRNVFVCLFVFYLLHIMFYFLFTFQWKKYVKMNKEPKHSKMHYKKKFIVGHALVCLTAANNWR